MPRHTDKEFHCTSYRTKAMLIYVLFDRTSYTPRHNEIYTIQSLLLRPWSRHPSPNHARQVLFTDTIQQSDTPRQRRHDEDGEAGEEEERRTDVLLLARRPTPVGRFYSNRLVFAVFDIDNASSAAACPAVVCGVFAGGVSILLVATSMTTTALGCGDAKSLGGVADRHGDFRSGRGIGGVKICWY